MRKPTIADAKENGWLVSVTTVIKALHKPALQNWLIEQSVLAVITSPRRPGEKDDEFVHRILVEEEVQEQQARKAAQLGTDVHEAIEQAVNGEPYLPHLGPYVVPVLQNLSLLGNKVWSERVVVGKDYAGRSDYLGEDKEWLTLVDFKTTGKPPEKDAYDEHKMQVAAYAQALDNPAKKKIRTCLLYISTSAPGSVVPHIIHEWKRDFKAFQHLLEVWKYLNGVV